MHLPTVPLGSNPAASLGLQPFFFNPRFAQVAGLYCADGSCFPTPTGLNPMIT